MFRYYQNGGDERMINLLECRDIQLIKNKIWFYFIQRTRMGKDYMGIIFKNEDEAREEFYKLAKYLAKI